MCGTTALPTAVASPAWRASACFGWLWLYATTDDPFAESMQSVLEANLSDGIAYYCGFSRSTVGLLLNAEERSQRIDAEGNLLVGDVVSGTEREAQYTEFDRRTGKFVDEFLADELAAA